MCIIRNSIKKRTRYTWCEQIGNTQGKGEWGRGKGKEGRGKRNDIRYKVEGEGKDYVFWGRERVMGGVRLMTQDNI